MIHFISALRNLIAKFEVKSKDDEMSEASLNRTGRNIGRLILKSIAIETPDK
jgi:hypothetical protein